VYKKQIEVVRKKHAFIVPDISKEIEEKKHSECNFKYINIFVNFKNPSRWPGV
jgi:hypothetical protein